MRRIFFATALAASLFGALLGTAYAGEIVISPASGSQDDAFVFTGSGFAAGQQVSEGYVNAQGETRPILAPDGSPVILVAGEDGTFIATLYPRNDLPGVGPGDWVIRFCEADTGLCYFTVISILF